MIQVKVLHKFALINHSTVDHRC